MNNIQSLPDEKHGHIFSTLSAPFPPSPEHVLGYYKYTHPILTGDGMRAQPRLRRLNAHAEKSGRHRVFAGAWACYGAHEDGFTAGLFAAAALPGVVPPFQIADVEAEDVPRAGVMANVFDVLNVMRPYLCSIFSFCFSILFVVVSLVVRRYFSSWWYWVAVTRIGSPSFFPPCRCV